MVYTEEGNIHLDHALNIKVPTLPSSLERTLNKVLKSLERACDGISHSITIVGYAAAAYLVMAGVAKMMEARYKRLPPPPPPSHNHDEQHKRNKKRSNKKRDGRDKGVGGGKDDDRKEEWEDTPDWVKEVEDDPSLLDNIP